MNILIRMLLGKRQRVISHSEANKKGDINGPVKCDSKELRNVIKVT